MTSQTSELVELLRDLTDDHRIPRCYARQAERLLERLSSSEVTEEMIRAGERELGVLPGGVIWGSILPKVYRAMRSAATSERKG